MVALPLLRVTNSDVRAMRSMLLLLPPELLERLPSVVRFINEITGNDGDKRQSQHDDDDAAHEHDGDLTRHGSDREPDGAPGGESKGVAKFRYGSAKRMRPEKRQ